MKTFDEWRTFQWGRMIDAHMVNEILNDWEADHNQLIARTEELGNEVATVEHYWKERVAEFERDQT